MAHGCAAQDSDGCGGAFPRGRVKLETGSTCFSFKRRNQARSTSRFNSQPFRNWVNRKSFSVARYLHSTAFSTPFSHEPTFPLPPSRNWSPRAPVNPTASTLLRRLRCWHHELRAKKEINHHRKRCVTEKCDSLASSLMALPTPTPAPKYDMCVVIARLEGDP